MIFPSFAALQKKNNGPLGGVQPDALDAARKRQQAAGSGSGGGLSPMADLAKAQDAATIATAQGDPNAAEMAAKLQQQKQGLREQQLTKEAEAEARIKAKAEAAGEAAKAEAEAGPRVMRAGVGSPGITADMLNAHNTPQRQAERDAGIFFRSQKDRRLRG